MTTIEKVIEKLNEQIKGESGLYGKGLIQARYLLMDALPAEREAIEGAYKDALTQHSAQEKEDIKKWASTYFESTYKK